MDLLSTDSTKDKDGGSSDTASNTYYSGPEINAEQEFFLYELETTDSGSIGLVLRAIYDCGDVKKFSRALEHRIHIYDRSIQNVCSHHYQSFVVSMKQLMQLQDRSEDIKKDFIAIDSKIQAASEDLKEKSADIVKYRKLTKNATTAIDQISLCLPALENYAKLQSLMEQKKYYQALKVLEELEHTHLALVEKYRFTQLFANSLIPIRKKIKQNAYSEFKDFLENIKKVAGKIGRHASKCTAEQHSFGASEAERAKLLLEESRKRADDVEVTLSSDGSLIKKKVTPTPRTSKKDDELYGDEAISAQDIQDFTPIHRCFQIFNVLGAKEEFESYYREQRTEQCKLVSLQSGKKTSLHNYIEYLDEVIGFFVIEDRILDTEPSLGTAAYKEALWEDSLKKVITTMNNGFGMSLEVKSMLLMKKVVLLFAITMKSYGYSIAALYSLLQNFRDQYSAVLLKGYQDQFMENLDSDNYSPVTAENEEQFKAIIRQFPFYKRSIEQEAFPRKFPFSRFVITVYGYAKSYLDAIMKFLKHLQMKHSDIDDTLRRHANILIKRWSEILKQYVSVNKNLVKLIQITINIGYLEKSCESLGGFITKLANGGEMSATSTGYQVPLLERDFRDARSEVEQRIEESLTEKVDEFLELARYDWELPSSAGHASDFITDLLAFLTTTFISFTELPSALARHICTQTCKHITQRLLEMLLASDVRYLSQGALEQLSLDVMQCEMFAERCSIAGLEKGALPVTFAHLRQLLNLVLESDWTTYVADFGRPTSKYSRVQPSNAILILEKMIEFEKKSAGFFNFNKGDRRKFYDTLIKQLQQKMAQ